MNKKAYTKWKLLPHHYENGSNGRDDVDLVIFKSVMRDLIIEVAGYEYFHDHRFAKINKQKQHRALMLALSDAHKVLADLEAYLIPQLTSHIRRRAREVNADYAKLLPYLQKKKSPDARFHYLIAIYDALYFTSDKLDYYLTENPLD